LNGVMIPAPCKEIEIMVNPGQEDLVKEPKMGVIIHIKTMLQLQVFKKGCPLGTNLGSNINP